MGSKGSAPGGKLPHDPSRVDLHQIKSQSRAAEAYCTNEKSFTRFFQKIVGVDVVNKFTTGKAPTASRRKRNPILCGPAANQRKKGAVMNCIGDS